MAAADEQIRPCPLRLPDDVVSDILSRLAPRGMAVSRSVCKSWRDVVDSRRLLRADLLPLSVAGIFFRHTGADILFPPLFFDGASSTAISDGILARFGNDYTSYTYLHDHCNGLLLINKYVINPATLQCVTLPERPPPVPYVLLLPAAAGEEEEEVVHCQNMFLAFDPTVSVYYEVYLVPRLPLLPVDCNKPIIINPQLLEESQEEWWPPSPLHLHVFSSRTQQWEQRSFLRREGQPGIGTLAHVQSRLRQDLNLFLQNGAYCRGRLYLQYDNDYVMRINTSAGTYDLIQPPDGIDATKETQVYLGKSEKGVYYASVSYWLCRLQIWYLDESNEQQPQWVSRYDNTLLHVLPCNCNYPSDDDGPWILRYYDYDYDDDEEPWISPPNTDHDYVCPCRFHHHHPSDDHPSDDHCHKQQVVMPPIMDDDELECGSTGIENNTAPGSAEKDQWGNNNNKCFYTQFIRFLGFHPYKELVFLHHSGDRGIAYHWNCSKVQDLGSLIHNPLNLIHMSFTYTPCRIGDQLPENRTSSNLDIP